MMTRLSLSSLAIAGLLLCAHSAVAAPFKSCDYMTVQTASQAFGSALQAGKEQSMPMNSQQCVFERAGAQASLTFGVMDVNAVAAAMHTTPAAVLPMLQHSEGKAETIPSLGEWNSYVFNGLTTYTLTVLYHGKILDLDCTGSQNKNLKDALIQAMRQAMQKF